MCVCVCVCVGVVGGWIFWAVRHIGAEEEEGGRENSGESGRRSSFDVAQARLAELWKWWLVLIELGAWLVECGCVCVCVGVMGGWIFWAVGHVKTVESCQMEIDGVDEDRG